MTVYTRLLAHFGHRDWWPGDSRLEIMVGAVLTQNTNWGNVEKAIANLKQARVLSVGKLLAMDDETLGNLIRPSGYFNVKAKRLKALLQFILDEGGKNYKQFQNLATDLFRQKLLEVNGVGEETADSILLYAFERPIFVIDAYTKRIAHRLGWAEKDAKYGPLQKLFMTGLDEDVALFNDYHAQFVALGNHNCKPKPKCVTCPLAGICKKAGV